MKELIQAQWSSSQKREKEFTCCIVISMTNESICPLSCTVTTWLAIRVLDAYDLCTRRV